MCDVIITASMTYYVGFTFVLILLFFLRFDSLGKQLSRWKTTWKPTQRIIQRLIFLIRRIDWSDQLLSFLLDKNSHKFFTATTAIINFVLFILPGQPASYGIPCGILGKMYSNTMMVILNNRIVLQAQDESIILDEHVSSSASMSNPGISKTCI